MSKPVAAAGCSHCRKDSYWLAETRIGVDGVTTVQDGRMLYPNVGVAAMPHPDMPDAVRCDYEEARNIASLSPRGAAALLRQSIQKMCVQLGQPGKNLNDDIGALVQLGLPIEIQQALDVVRVIGNNAVHPGELQESDVAGVAAMLFELVNSIVEERVARPKKLKALYGALPASALQAIEKRDSK